MDMIYIYMYIYILAVDSIQTNDAQYLCPAECVVYHERDYWSADSAHRYVKAQT